jgi:hypothetical protein
MLIANKCIFTIFVCLAWQQFHFMFRIPKILCENITKINDYGYYKTDNIQKIKYLTS